MSVISLISPICQEQICRRAVCLNWYLKLKVKESICPETSGKTGKRLSFFVYETC